MNYFYPKSQFPKRSFIGSANKAWASVYFRVSSKQGKKKITAKDPVFTFSFAAVPCARCSCRPRRSFSSASGSSPWARDSHGVRRWPAVGRESGQSERWFRVCAGKKQTNKLKALHLGSPRYELASAGSFRKLGSLSLSLTVAVTDSDFSSKHAPAGVLPGWRAVGGWAAPGCSVIVRRRRRCCRWWCRMKGASCCCCWLHLLCCAKSTSCCCCWSSCCSSLNLRQLSRLAHLVLLRLMVPLPKLWWWWCCCCCSASSCCCWSSTSSSAGGRLVAGSSCMLPPAAERARAWLATSSSPFLLVVVVADSRPSHPRACPYRLARRRRPTCVACVRIDDCARELWWRLCCWVM